MTAEAVARQRSEGRACCRVDLAGGTLDIWPLGLLHAGARTVNVAIDVVARVRLEPATACRVRGADEVEGESWTEVSRNPSAALVGLLGEALELPAMAVEVSSDSPVGAGLGGSSAVGVAMIAAVESALGRPASSARARAATVRDVEARLMGLPTGRQDQYAALLGGALEIRYVAGGERVERLDVDLEALGRSLVVAYSGRSHFSAGKNWEVVRRRLDGDPASVRLFDGIAAAAEDVASALRADDLEAVGRGMTREWACRSRLAEGVSTTELEALLAGALDAGAWGGKATGAGGGGCVAVLTAADRRADVEAALVAAGGRVLPAAPCARGVEARSVPSG